VFIVAAQIYNINILADAPIVVVVFVVPPSPKK
jgi:hypothetical protein